jgi:hypothetical protein
LQLSVATRSWQEKKIYEYIILGCQQEDSGRGFGTVGDQKPLVGDWNDSSCSVFSCHEWMFVMDKFASSDNK